MGARRGWLIVLALAVTAVGAEATIDAYYQRLQEQQQAQVEPQPEYTMQTVCRAGLLYLSVDGAPSECMSQEQYDWRMLAARKGPEFIAISKELCDAGNQFDCAELARIGASHVN